MISQIFSVAAVHAPRNFDAYLGDLEVCRFAQGYRGGGSAVLHLNQVGLELCEP